MGELAGVLVLLAIGALVSGPAAFILTLTLFRRIGKLEEKLRWMATTRQPEASPKPVPAPVSPPTAPPEQIGRAHV